MKEIVPQKIVGQLQKIRGAEAILFTGSRALGKTNRHSDWDFYVMLKNGQRRWRKTWKYEDTWIEIFCNDSKQIIQEFKEDLSEGRGVTTHMFAHGIIIKDTKQGLLKKLVTTAKKNWKQGPNKLSPKEKEWISYDMSTYVQDITDCLLHGNAAELLFNQALNECVRYYYRLGNMWFPRPKDRLIDLEKRDKSLCKIVDAAILSRDWPNKAKLIIKLCNFLGKKYKLSLNGELYVPPKSAK